jgi:hypothetical protein
MKMERGVFRTYHLVFGIFAGIMASFTLSFFFHTNIELTFMLLIFNILYILLTFPLDGALMKKLCMLLLGNVICLIWNSLFLMFAVATAEYFAGFFDVLYIILNPFLNLIWVVSFWSISLTIFAVPRRESEA